MRHAIPAAPDPPPVHVPLAYAPAPPRGRRRRRRLLLALFLLGVLGALWHWHAPLLAHGQLLVWQAECGRYALAPDAVVASTAGPGNGAALPAPACWTTYERSAVPLLSTRLPVTFNPSFLQTVAFLHRRTSPGGHERVVAVRCVVTYLSSASVVQAFQGVVVRPAGAWPLSDVPSVSYGPFHGGYPVGANVQVFAGQPDPADASRFTIAYTVEGKPGVIDGRLGDDDTVTLKVREGSVDVMGVLKARGQRKPESP